MSRYEDYYNSFYRELSEIDERHNSLSKINRLLPELMPGARVLDIGCGHGSVSSELVSMGFCVYGMEINSDALRSLRVKGIIPLEHDIVKPFPEMEPFELVLLLDVLEHVFDPAALLAQAVRTLAPNGKIIITVPLYFDLIDRMRILVTGNIISYDNRCYGPKLYGKFRSYNYDHIRFFRPCDVLELCRLVEVTVESIEYNPLPSACFGSICHLLVRLLSNRFTIKLFPGLLAHSMTLRVRR